MKKTVFVTAFLLLIAMALVSANPVLTAIPNNTTAENSALALTLTFTAADNGSVSLTDNLTFGTFGTPTATSVVYTVNPTYTDAGTHDVLITATDGNSSSTQTFTLTVTNTNRLPTITVPAQSFAKGLSRQLNLSSYASDADNEALTYTATTSDATKATCNVYNTNMLNITAVNIGTATCTVNVTDASGGVSQGTFSVNVQTQNPQMTISQSGTSKLLVYPTGDSDPVTILVTNTGNVPLSNVVVTTTDLIGTTKNITFQNTYTISSLDIGATDTKVFTASIVDSVYPTQVYTSTVGAVSGSTSATGSVSVTVQTPSYGLVVPGSVTLGSSTQDRNVTTSSVIFDISNNGDYTLTNVALTASADSKYNLEFSIDNTNWKSALTSTDLSSLNINQNKSIYVRTFVPDSQSSKKTDFGSITISSDQVSKTINLLYLETKTSLKITDLDVWADGDKTSNVDEGDTVDNVDPGAKLEFSVEVTNELYDLKMKNVEVTVTIKDIDDGDDIDDTSSSFDINDDDNKKTDVTLNLPDRVDEDDYTVEVEVKGEDEDGADFYDKRTFLIKIEKKSHEVAITRAELRTDTLQCLRNTNLDIDIINLGGNDEDEVVLEVKSPSLDLDYIQRDIELYKGSGNDAEFSKSFNIDLGDDFKAGSYPITVNLYYRPGVLDDQKTLTLSVKDCSINPKTVPNTNTDSNDEEVIVQTNVNQQIPSNVVGKVIPSTNTGSSSDIFTDSTAYVAILVIVNLTLIGGLAYLIFLLL